jgi:hypothetical protein
LPRKLFENRKKIETIKRSSETVNSDDETKDERRGVGKVDEERRALKIDTCVN